MESDNSSNENRHFICIPMSQETFLFLNSIFEGIYGLWTIRQIVAISIFYHIDQIYDSSKEQYNKKGEEMTFNMYIILQVIAFICLFVFNIAPSLLVHTCKSMNISLKDEDDPNIYSKNFTMLMKYLKIYQRINVTRIIFYATFAVLFLFQISFVGSLSVLNTNMFFSNRVIDPEMMTKDEI